MSRTAQQNKDDDKQILHALFKYSTKITSTFSTAAVTPHIETKVKFKSQLQSCNNNVRPTDDS